MISSTDNVNDENLTNNNSEKIPTLLTLAKIWVFIFIKY